MAPYYKLGAAHNQQHRDIIEAAGGEYIPGMFGDLVLFNSKQTGSTLCLKEKDLTIAAVHLHIKESNDKFGVKTPRRKS